jgi:heme/copper-type cytochrome/quinol oxidase subunit 1
MQPPSKLNLPQRVAALVGLAAALATLGWWVAVETAPLDSWTSYAPMSESRHHSPVGDHHTLLVVVVTLSLTAVWLAAALWLLGDRSRPSPD